MPMYAFSGLSLKKEAAFGVVDNTLGTVLVFAFPLFKTYTHRKK